MHRVVAWVFKFIGISIMLMILFDTGLVITDAFITNGRIQAQANLMQLELAKNNYLSEEAMDTFEGYYVDYDDGTHEGAGLQNVVGLSKVYTDITFNRKELKEIKNYGDYHTLKIDATFTPWHYYFSGVVNGEGFKKIMGESVIHYVFTVPCLRYIK